MDTPTAEGSASPAGPLTLEQLMSGPYHTVIVAAPDMQGRLFGRRLTIPGFRRALENGVDICTCIFGWDIAQDNKMLMSGKLEYTGFHTGMGDLRLEVDPNTLRPGAWLDGVAIAMADAVDVADGGAVAVAPRSILRTQIDALRDEGYEVSVATELEFFLYEGTPAELHAAGYRDPRPTTLSPADYSIFEGNLYEPFFQELRAYLAASRIDVDAAQVEWGLGQWEMTLRHGDPLEVADRHALYKMAVREVAARHGMSATFMAIPFDNGPGCSCHMHLSMRDLQGAPIFYDQAVAHQMSGIMRQAVGGSLAHAPELMAWYAPTVNSYKRVLGQGAAGWGQTWGADNRSTSVRVVGHRPEDLRLEFRLAGADTNPYLAIAALLASVRAGMAADTQPGDPITGNAYEQAATGMPSHLGEAIDRFGTADMPRASFGDAVVDHYTRVGREEWTEFLRHVTDWERERYFRLI